jgi:hypothetical protein
MNESGWRIQGPTARITHTPQHAADIARATKKKKGCHRE